MATILPNDEVFLDTSYAIALSAPTDNYHARAVALAGEMAAARARIVTTRAVLFEIGNSLARQRYRPAAVTLLNAIERDANVEIALLSDQSYFDAFALFASRMDKEWGLIDCLSFTVMSERGIVKALTADDHFRQAGFQSLLLE